MRWNLSACKEEEEIDVNIGSETLPIPTKGKRTLRARASCDLLTWV